MSDHYPQYPGEDPGPVEPPRAPQAPHGAVGPPRNQVPQPPAGSQPPRPPQGGWAPPPEPPRPTAPPTQPATVRAAVWAMVLGAVVSVAQTLLLFTELDVLREAMYEGARSSESGVDDPTFNDPAFDTFVDIMVVVIVAGTCLITLVVVGLWVWMALANARGRSWARVTASVLGGINLAMCLLNLAFVPLQEMSPEFVGPSPGTSAVGVALTVLYAAVSALALLLLWLPSSTTYVRAVTAQTRWETWSARWGRSAPATG